MLGACEAQVCVDKASDPGGALRVEPAGHEARGSKIARAESAQGINGLNLGLHSVDRQEHPLRACGEHGLGSDQNGSAEHETE